MQKRKQHVTTAITKPNEHAQSHIKKNVLQLWVKNSWQKYLGFYMIQYANDKFYDSQDIM